jgi:hypothetical protein
MGSWLFVCRIHCKGKVPKANKQFPIFLRLFLVCLVFMAASYCLRHVEY